MRKKKLHRPVSALFAHYASSFSFARIGCFARTWLVLTLVLSLTTIVTVAHAKESDETTQLTTIYDLSGVHAHLSWILYTVQSESKGFQQTCESNELPDLEQTLHELLSEEALRESFLQELADRISPTQRGEILEWAKSEAGQQIHKAEADSINLDPEQFQSMLGEFKALHEDVQTRVERMKKMLADTGAVHFISAVNTETSALVSMASVCSNSAEDVGYAVEEISADRANEVVYRAFMHNELLLPTSVVYQDISDENIDAYSAFAKTNAGNAYFAALIHGVRQILSERVNGLRDSLEAM